MLRITPAQCALAREHSQVDETKQIRNQTKNYRFQRPPMELVAEHNIVNAIEIGRVEMVNTSNWAKKRRRGRVWGSKNISISIVKHNAPRWKQVDTDTLGASKIVTCNIISKRIRPCCTGGYTSVYTVHNSNSLNTFRFSFISSVTHRYTPWHALQARFASVLASGETEAHLLNNNRLWCSDPK